MYSVETECVRTYVTKLHRKFTFIKLVKSTVWA